MTPGTATPRKAPRPTSGESRPAISSAARCACCARTCTSSASSCRTARVPSPSGSSSSCTRASPTRWWASSCVRASTAWWTSRARCCTSGGTTASSSDCCAPSRTSTARWATTRRWPSCPKARPCCSVAKRNSRCGRGWYTHGADCFLRRAMFGEDWP